MPFIEDQTLPQKVQPITTDNKKKVSFLGSIGNVIKGVADVGEGLIKSGYQTVEGMSELGQKALNKLWSPIMPEQPIQKLPSSLTQPTNSIQQAAKTVGEIGQFFIPVGGEAKAATLLEKAIPGISKAATSGLKAAKALSFGAKTLGSAAEFAGKTLLQTGSPEEAKTSGIIGGTGTGAILGAKAIAPKAGEAVASVLANFIGKDKEHIIMAFKNPSEVAKKISEKVIPQQVREKAVASLNQYRQNFSTAFEQGLNNIQATFKGQSPAGLEAQKAGTEILTEKSVARIPNIFRKFAVSVSNNGKLNFNKLNSAIVSGGEQKNLQAVYDTLRTQKDFSPLGMQRAAARINALSKFTEGNRTESSAIVTQIHNAYDKVIEKVYPKLKNLRNSYKTSTEIYKGIDDVLKSAKNEKVNPIAVTSVIKRLSNVFNEDNEAYIDALKRLEQVSGQDILKDLVASEFLEYAPTSFGSRVAQASLLAGGIFYNPAIVAALPLFSPRFVGRATTTAGRVFPLAGKVAEQIPKTIPPLFLNNNQ